MSSSPLRDGPTPLGVRWSRLGGASQPFQRFPLVESED